MTTISDYIAKNGSGSFPSDTRIIVDLVRQSIASDKLEFSTELELQDLIYEKTHNVHFTSMAEEIFETYLRKQAVSDWNASTCRHVLKDGGKFDA